MEYLFLDIDTIFSLKIIFIGLIYFLVFLKHEEWMRVQPTGVSDWKISYITHEVVNLLICNGRTQVRFFIHYIHWHFFWRFTMSYVCEKCHVLSWFSVSANVKAKIISGRCEIQKMLFGRKSFLTSIFFFFTTQKHLPKCFCIS